MKQPNRRIFDPGGGSLFLVPRPLHFLCLCCILEDFGYFRAEIPLFNGTRTIARYRDAAVSSTEVITDFRPGSNQGADDLLVATVRRIDRIFFFKVAMFSFKLKRFSSLHGRFKRGKPIFWTNRCPSLQKDSHDLQLASKSGPAQSVPRS